MDYKKINDYEVVYLVKENDEEARKIMFNKYIPIVKKLASKYSMSAKWARVDFDDLVQEGLIALNDAIDKYDENSGALFYTFACICVERRILTFCRKMSSNKHYYLNTSLGEEFYYNIKDDKNLDYYFDEELLEKQFVYYKSLFNIGDSSIFELRYNGFSYKEISRLLDIPITTVDGRLYKIRKVLHERFKNVY